MLPVQISAQDTAGVGGITGTVVDADHKPALAVTICVVDTTRCVITDPLGHFHLAEIRPGSYRLEITAPGHPSIVSEPLEVRAGIDAVVEVTLPKFEGVEEKVTVTAPVFAAPEEIKSSRYLVRPEEILSSASALQDVSRYLQTLPGVVVGSDDFRNDIIVRGGSPLENLFIVDNIEVPNINSFANFASAGGTVSIVDAAMIQDVTFLTGGYPAPYINRVSSVLQIAQREGNREHFGGRATVGFAGAGGILEGPVGSAGKGSWIVSARRSFLDLFMQDAGFGGVPVLYTANAKVVYDLTLRDRVWAVNITGVDRIRLGLTEDSNLEDQVSGYDIRYEGWRSATGVNWQRLFKGGVGLLGVTHSEARLTSSVKDLLRNGIPPESMPADEVIANGPIVFTDQSREGETTVKYDVTFYTTIGKVQAGGSLKRFGLDYETASPLGDDSPYSLEPGVNPFALRKIDTTYQTGAYAQATRDLLPRLNVTLGARFDHYDYIGRARVSPRAGVSVRLSDAWSWQTSYGTYYQQPFFMFLAAFPENRRVLPFRADHYVTGVSRTSSNASRFGVEVYTKVYSDYPVSSQFPSLSLANVGDTFNTRQVLFPLVSEGHGRASGVELLYEKKLTSTWYGQANLTFSRAQHAGLDGVRRPGSFDYPFVANVAGTWLFSRGWQASARVAWLGGRPYTPFDEALSLSQSRGIYDLSQVNALRAPDYFRLDVRVERRFGTALTVFGGAQNLTNRRNFAGYSWNRRLGRTEFDEQLGVFPFVGLDWRF